MRAEGRAARPRRFVHLGERLVAVARIHAGASIGQTAQALGVDAEEVASWLRAHAGERVPSLEEIRRGGSPEHLRLSQRARRLATLIAASERELRELHQELIAGLDASNDPEAEPSKDLACNSQSGAPRVASSQRAGAHARKFVDGDSTR